MSNWFWYLGFSAEWVFSTSVERQKEEEVIILKMCPFKSAKLYGMIKSLFSLFQILRDCYSLLGFRRRIVCEILYYMIKKEIDKFAVLDVHWEYFRDRRARGILPPAIGCMRATRKHSTRSTIWKRWVSLSSQCTMGNKGKMVKTFKAKYALTLTGLNFVLH